MPSTQKFLSATLVFLLVSAICNAEIRLPAIIGSNMVLQQQTTVNFWGWGDPFEKVVISTTWGNAIDSTVCTAEGKWKTTVSTPAAGGPYIITIRGWNTLVLENVLIGEVWLCSGQSNMEWSAMNNNK